MKEKMNHAFKTTPKRFYTSIEYSIEQAICSSKSKTRKCIALRFVAIALILLVMVPVTVFGAVKLFSVQPKKVADFGLSFSVTPNTQAPKYVKMVVDLPDEFEQMKNTDGTKYHRKETDEHVFSILPMQITQKTDLTKVETDVKTIEQISLSEHLAYRIIEADGYEGLDRYYVWFENANVLMLVYRGENVTDSELEAFVKGIRFIEGTESDHYKFFDSSIDENMLKNENVSFEDSRSCVELDKNEVITFCQINEETNDTDILIKSSIKDIRVKDNINDLKKDGINKLFDISEVADSNGALLPDTVDIWQNGDGINIQTKRIKSVEKSQQIVLVDIEFENTSHKDVQMYIPHRLQTLKKLSNGTYEPTTVIDKEKNIAVDSYCDTEIFYLSDYGDGRKSFYIPTIKAQEKKTITVGFRCAKDQMDNAYVVLSSIFDGIYSPKYTDNNNNMYTYYIFKVQ